MNKRGHNVLANLHCERCAGKLAEVGFNYEVSATLRRPSRLTKNGKVKSEKATIIEEDLGYGDFYASCGSCGEELDYDTKMALIALLRGDSLDTLHLDYLCGVCGLPSDDGEGWDNRCGSCADKHESRNSHE